MLDFRYRGSVVLVHGLFVAASWLMHADGAKNAQSCVQRKDEDESIFRATASMVQRDVLESAMRVDEERPEVLEVAAPDARLTKVEAPKVAAVRLSKVEASKVAAPDAPQSKVEATPAPKVVAQRQQQLPGKYHAGSPLEAGNSKDVGSLMAAFGRRYTASAAVGAQLLHSMKLRVADEFREFSRRLGVKELELVTTRVSWANPILVSLAVVTFIVLLIAVRAWWKEQRDVFLDPKSQQARGSFQEASSFPQPPHATQASQRPSIMGLIASPGKQRELTPGKTPQKLATPLVPQTSLSPLVQQASETPLVQQKSWQSERRSATPTGGLADTLPDTLDDTPKSLDQERHLCTELVVPDDSECRLFLPDLKENKMSDVLSIDGVNGMAVLYASYTIADRPPAG